LKTEDKTNQKKKHEKPTTLNGHLFLKTLQSNRKRDKENWPKRERKKNKKKIVCRFLKEL